MFVDKPDRFSSCAILPGRTADPDGFVTEHRALDGINGPIKLYFSVKGLRHLAQKYPQARLALREDLELAQERIEGLERMLEQANADLDQAVESLEGFRRALKQLGFKEPKPMGRPPKKES